MLDAVMCRANQWALARIAPKWINYVVSNTMTDFNRWLNGFVWTYELKAQVVAVHDEAPGVKTYVLRPNQHWRGFKPGQHVQVQLPIGDDGDQGLGRYYSVSAAPAGQFSITVKRQEGGVGSAWMHEHLRPGMTLPISQAQGRFCHQGQAKVLYLCAGSGITPCHSMVQSLLQGPQGECPDMAVIAQFRQPSDVIFKQALRAWAEAGVKVHTALTGQGAGAQAPGSASRLDAQRLIALCPDVAQRDIYLCGPTGFMTQMMDHLIALGVDMSRVHTERFVAAGVSAPDAGDFDIEGAEVYFQHLGERITLRAQDQGKTLLQLAAEHGLVLESGCCQGMCGTCKLSVHAGQVSGNVLGRVVYLCTAYPASRSVVLDA